MAHLALAKLVSADELTRIARFMLKEAPRVQGPK